MSILLKSKEDKYIGYDCIIVDNTNLAIHFNSKAAAESYRENCLTKIAKNFEWDVVNVNDNYTKSNRSDFVVQLELIKNRFSTCSFENELCKSIIPYLDNLISILNTEKKVSTLLSNYDRMLVDIQHFIELNDISTIKAEDVIRLQHQILVKRRNCKNRIYTIKRIKDIGLKPYKNLISSFEGMSNRQYKNRY